MKVEQLTTHIGAELMGVDLAEAVRNDDLFGEIKAALPYLTDDERAELDRLLALDLARVPWRPLLVFGAAVVIAFVIDSSVSNWPAVSLSSLTGCSASSTR